MFSNHVQPLAATLGLLIVLTGAGCQQLEQALAGAPKPGADIRGVRFGNIDLEQATMLFDVDITNPYDVEIPLLDLDYALETGGAKFLTGKGDLSGMLPAKGTKTFEIPATVNFKQLLAAAQGVRPGEVVPYTASMNVFYDAPVVGRKSWPVSKKGELPVPTAPEVKISAIEFEKLDLTEASALVKLNLKNTNKFKVDVNELAYGLSLGGSEVARSALADPAKFDPGDSEDITIPISFSPTQFGLALFNMLRGEGADYEIAGNMNVDTPFGQMNLPYQRAGDTVLKRN